MRVSRRLSLQAMMIASLLYGAGPTLAQDILVHCTVETPGQPAVDIAFGFDANAARGADILDLPLPPPPPEAPLAIHLAMDMPGMALPDRWSTDIRPAVDFWTEPGLSHVELWRMHVASTEVRALTLRAAIAGPAPPLKLRLLTPGGPMDIGFGGAFDVVLPAGAEDFYWELSADREIEADSRSWSDLKSLYR